MPIDKVERRKVTAGSFPKPFLLPGRHSRFGGLGPLIGKTGQRLGLAQQESSHKESGNGQNRRALQAKVGDAEHRQHGTHGAAQVAAHGKVADAPAFALASHIIGHASAVGMEQGRADTGEGHRCKHGPIAVQKSQHGNATARHKDAQTHHPGPGVFVGHGAEHRLDHRTDAAEGKGQSGCRSQADPFLSHQKG